MVKPGPKRQKEYSTCIKIVTLKTNWGMKNLKDIIESVFQQ